ncbi:hypothetical protein AU190_22245 [Mycolicibacterium acapulense]|nr:hypothetical protein AU190_22245 [Mycolicibacterium acapulense]
MASELSKMRSSCDFCSPSVELATYLDGALIVCDIHHEPGCSFSKHLREQLITPGEIAQALDDAPVAGQ